MPMRDEMRSSEDRRRNRLQSSVIHWLPRTNHSQECCCSVQRVTIIIIIIIIIIITRQRYYERICSLLFAYHTSLTILNHWNYNKWCLECHYQFGCLPHDATFWFTPRLGLCFLLLCSYVFVLPTLFLYSIVFITSFHCPGNRMNFLFQLDISKQPFFLFMRIASVTYYQWLLSSFLSSLVTSFNRFFP